MATTPDIEALAAKIGESIYIDVAKWHLYLNDAHLHTVVAEKIYPLLEANALTEDAVADVLKDIPVKLGGGQTELSLSQLLPMQCQMNLIDLLEEYQQDM
jgi:ABC-type phosphate transport system ATPase subunit